MTHKDNYEILQVLAEGTQEEKSVALELLREVQDVSWVSPLVETLEKENSRAVKERILTVLDLLIPHAKQEKVNVDLEIDRMLRSPDPFVRNGVVEIIRRSEMPIIQFLEGLAADPDKDVRKFVIDALSLEKTERGMEILRQRLHDPEINIVYTAVEILGNFRDIASAGAIETLLLSSANLMVVCSALEALAKIGESPRREKILETFMKKGIDPVAAFALLKYLGTFGDGGAFSYIESMLDSGGEIFAKEIIDSVEGIVKNRGIDILPESLRQKLKTLRQNTSNSINKYAITKLLLKTAGDDTAEIREQLEQNRRMLEDESEMVQLCAVEVLAEIGDESDGQRLEELAQQTESDELLEAIGDAVMKIYERQ